MTLQFLTLLLPVTVAAGAPLSTNIGAPGDTPWDLYSATFTPDNDTAAHATNFATLAVSQGVTVLASHATKTDEQGALTNGSPVELALQGRGASIHGAGHQLASGNSPPSAYTVSVTHGGSGAAVKGSLVVVLRRGQRIEPRE